jgi:hypothetical protein
MCFCFSSIILSVAMSLVPMLIHFIELGRPLSESSKGGVAATISQVTHDVQWNKEQIIFHLVCYSKN